MTWTQHKDRHLRRLDGGRFLEVSHTLGSHHWRAVDADYCPVSSGTARSESAAKALAEAKAVTLGWMTWDANRAREARAQVRM